MGNIKSIFLLVFLSLFSLNLFAFNIPGEVPLFDITQPEARLPAVDLIYKGKVQSVKELKDLETHWIKQLKVVKSSKSLTEEQKESLRSFSISKLSPAPQSIQKNWVDKLFLVDAGVNFSEPNGLQLLRSDNMKSVFSQLDEIGVNTGDIVKYFNIAPFKNDDLYDFRVSKVDKNNKSIQYRVYLGQKLHNILLRKTLLRKLGYQEPGIKYLPTLKLAFKTEAEAIKFMVGRVDGSAGATVFGLKSNTGSSDPRRWLTKDYKKTIIDRRVNEQGEEEEFEREVWSFEDKLPSGEVVVELQDVAIYKETGEFRLAFGNLDHDRNGRRRIYNSLLLAYNLVNPPESINSFSPVPFSIKSQKLILTHDPQYLNQFSPDYYDLKWMARKLTSLSRKDFEHIVEEGHYPKEVGLLLVELLVARRNHMQKFFFAKDNDCDGPLKYEVPPYYCLGGETQSSHPQLSAQFKVNLKVSSGDKLKEGRLTVDTRGADYRDVNKWWVGYGSRFSYHQEESPLVLSEILAYFRSIGESSILDFIIEQGINSHLKLDSDEKIKDQLQKLAAKQAQYFQDFDDDLNDGNPNDATLQTVPLGFYTVPTASAQIILNRNLAIGSQQGVDNQIQLVDTFGYAFSGGAQSELEGIRNLGLFENYQGQNIGRIGFAANYTFMRRWTHLRPIKVVKIPGAEDLDGPLRQALKTTYKDILIPKILRDFRKEIDYIEEISDGASEVEKEKYKQVLEKNYDVLNKYLKVGESLIISNTMGPALSGFYKHSFFDINANIFASFTIKSEDLSRVHILRKSEKEILIYKTKADQVAWSVSIGLEYYIPVVSLRHYKSSGHAKTWFHKINNIEPTTTVSKPNVPIETVINTDFQRNLAIVIDTVSQDSFSDADSYGDKNLLINKELPPYVINHRFKQRQLDFRFLFFNHSSHATSDKMSIHTPYSHLFPQFPEGHTTTYLRTMKGYRNGLDYQTVVEDVISYVLEDKGLEDLKLVTSKSGDPADTLFGKSSSVSIVLDSQISEPNSGMSPGPGNVFKNPFLKMHFTWKGGVDFGLSQRKTKKLLSEVNEQLSFTDRFELFDLDDFSKLKRLQLYRVGVDLVIFKEGIERIFEFSEHDFAQKFMRKLSQEKLKRFAFGSNERDNVDSYIINPIELSLRKEYSDCKKAKRRNKAKKLSECLINLVGLLQEHLSFDDFISYFDDVPKDGDLKTKPLRNVYIKGIVSGFKLGDEKLDPVLSNEIGFPRKKSVNGTAYDYTYGDIELIKNRIGINNNEFYLNWILRSYL